MHFASWLGRLRPHIKKVETPEINIPLFVQVVTEKSKMNGKYIPGCYIEANKDEALVYAKFCVTMRRKPYLFIPVQLSNGKHLPVVDIDNDTGMVIDKYIHSEPTSVIFQSSENNRYWIIIDKPCDTVDNALDQIISSSLFKVADRRYLECVGEAQQFVLRAIPKRGTIPKVIYSKIVTPETRIWIKNFTEWWEISEIKEMADMQVLEAL
jgi:hypothetical protein